MISGLNPLPAICLAGPTASGKTAAALAIAQRWPAEIISVDSALVYRGMDIGTAKPSAAELTTVPHHLINIREPHQPYSAAEFVTDAQALVADITARGKLALLVGGTMMYFKALFDGLDDMPRADPTVRAEIEAQATVRGWPALHAQLAQVDPITAARLAPGDSQRIQRALEVFTVSGKPLSSFQSRASNHSDAIKYIAAPAVSTRAKVLFSLEPHDRAWLHARIAQRLDTMLAAGLVDEVCHLRQRAELHADLPAMRCVGYRQVWQALDESEATGGSINLTALRDKSIFATRQLAKRQLTWLRSMPHRQVVACDAPDAVVQLVAAVAAEIHQFPRPG